MPCPGGTAHDRRSPGTGSSNQQSVVSSAHAVTPVIDRPLDAGRRPALRLRPRPGGRPRLFGLTARLSHQRSLSVESYACRPARSAASFRPPRSSCLVAAGSFGLACRGLPAAVPWVILWLAWLPFRSSVRCPAGHKAWMSHPCRLNSMNAASTPYVGRPAGPGCGVEVTSGAESAAVGRAGTHEPAQRRNRFIEWRRILGPYYALTRYATHCDDKLPSRYIAQPKVAVRSSGSRPAR